MPLEKEKRDFSDLFHSSSYGEPSPGRDQRGVDWHKLASLEMAELAIPCVDTGALVQDHLSYITTCDAASELDLSKAADRRSLLKLFRISQHLLRHLIGSQRQQLDDLSKTKEQLAIYMEKYAQSKTKLLQQIAEAKKMKENNRNLRDTVKFINSVAISKGIVHPVKCDYCPKIFREWEYLRSHMERKHVTKHNKAKHRLSPRATATSPSVNHNNITLVENDNILENFANGNNKESNELDEVCLDVHDTSPNTANAITRIQQQAVYTKRKGDISADHEIESPKHHNVHESIRTNAHFPENHQHRVVHENKMHELEEKCRGLYEKFSVAMKKFQEEKQDWNKQIVMSRNEAEATRQEKIELENTFRIQLDFMNKKLKELEGRTMVSAEMPVGIHKELLDRPLTDLTLIKHGQKEEVGRLHAGTNNHSKTKAQVKLDVISQLQAKLIAQKLANNVTEEEDSEESSSEKKMEKEEACLSSITEVSAENDENNFQEDSIYDINSLPSDNEVRDSHQVRTEKLDTKSRNRDKRRNSSGSNTIQDAPRQVVDEISSFRPSSVQKTRLIPSPKARSSIPPKVEKILLKAKDSTFGKLVNEGDELQDTMDENSNAGKSPAKYVDSKKISRAFARNDTDDVSRQKSKHIEEAMYDSASDSSSEDTSKNSALEENTLPDFKRSLKGGQNLDPEVDDNETSSIKDDSSKSLKKLDDILGENRHLWKQLRQATDEVINSKLSIMEIDPNVGLDKSSYKKAIRTLRSERKHLEKKHSNFNKLRKRIHHQLKSMMKKNEQILDMSDEKSRKTFSAFKRAGQSVKKKLNKKSDYIRKFRKVSNTVPAKESNSPRPLGRVLVCTNADASAEQRDNTNTETPVGSVHENYSSESEDDPSDLLDEKLDGEVINQPFTKPEFETVIDIHNETRQSARRNLIGESLKPSETQPEDDNSVSTIQPDDDQENGIDNLAITNHSHRGSDEFLEEVEVNEEDESDDEEVLRPPTRVGSFFQARVTTSDDECNTSSQHYESQDKYEEQEYKNIKLKQATGKNILKLKANIEAQLMQRQKGKPPAGAVDVAPPGGDKTTDGSAAATTTSQETRVMGFWDDSTED